LGGSDGLCVKFLRGHNTLLCEGLDVARSERVLEEFLGLVRGLLSELLVHDRSPLVGRQCLTYGHDHCAMQHIPCALRQTWAHRSGSTTKGGSQACSSEQLHRSWLGSA